MQSNPPQYQSVQLQRFLLERKKIKYYQFLLQESIPGIWNPGSADRDLTWILLHPAAGSWHVHVSAVSRVAMGRAAATSVSSLPRTRLNGENILNCDRIHNTHMTH